jgi:hypothetical protein
MPAYCTTIPGEPAGCVDTLSDPAVASEVLCTRKSTKYYTASGNDPAALAAEADDGTSLWTATVKKTTA